MLPSYFFALAYLVAAVLFILCLKGLSSPASARSGNLYGMAGMAVAIAATLFQPGIHNHALIVGVILAGGAVGLVLALKIQMTAMPQLMALLHSFVGLAATLVAISTYLNFGHDQAHTGTGTLIEMVLGAIIGAITFTGSLVAFGKLQELIDGKPLQFPGRNQFNLALGLTSLALGLSQIWHLDLTTFLVSVALALVLGLTLFMAVGGADAPVAISLLNSYSGWAAAATGFMLHNPMLIIAGALVGASGAILSYIMCKAMNRSLTNVLFGSQMQGGDGGPAVAVDRRYNSGDPEDISEILKSARSVIIVPGYGMAVAQAQHAVKELGDLLEKHGTKVRYAIHPVAGRMPGHMNVLLAEANVPYNLLFEMDDINSDFNQTDVAFVIGANDITNPAALKDPNSPIFGMPILEVNKAQTVIVSKRSMNPGYAGIDNELYYMPNTIMLFGDAKGSVEKTVNHLKGVVHH